MLRLDVGPVGNAQTCRAAKRVEYFKPRELCYFASGNGWSKRSLGGRALAGVADLETVANVTKMENLLWTLPVLAVFLSVLFAHLAYEEGVRVGRLSSGNRGEAASPLAPDLMRYREQLAEIETRSQAEFDKTVLALSGGALGVSYAFVNDFLALDTESNLTLLYASWAAWLVSLTAVLASHYLSTLALRKTIRQIDAGVIHSEAPGGAFDWFLVRLNLLGGVSFVAGAIMSVVFALLHLR